jgi:hypothetical protein
MEYRIDAIMLIRSTPTVAKVETRIECITLHSDDTFVI